MGCDFRLPELAIERIQSFLTGKEAARATLLSKSWRSAWLTRPDLDFDISGGSSSWDVVKKTMKRYEDSNLKIDSFRICMECGSDEVVRFIARALQIGATHITIQSRRFGDLVLPTKVLFRSQNLVALTVKGCKISRRINVRCPKLLYLCLDTVEIKRLRLISHIISSCPLLQNLSLSNIYYPGEDVVGTGKAPTLTKLPRLRSLVLSYVYFDTLFLCDLSSKFPCLKYLTLRRKYSNKEDQEEMLISSPLLEHLHFVTHEDDLSLKLDVPSIRLFSFEGRTVPSLSLCSTSSAGWESHVSIMKGPTIPSLSFSSPSRGDGSLSTSWFHKLSKFLKDLRSSRISLSLHPDYRMTCFDYKVGDIQGLPTHIIENLTISLANVQSLTWYALLDGLFLMCRPKLITPANNVDFIGKMLLHGLDGKFSTPINFMYGLNDLKEVRAQIFDGAVSTWRDVSLDALLDNLKTGKGEQEIRFQLKWKP